MQFLYPAFLFALLSLAIPVIIHLFYFRRFKKVYFSNVRFLKEIKEETSSRSRLRNLIVLAMRLLALLFLVLAFAQPFIPQDVEVKQGAKAVSVFVDNSFSMSALSQDVPLVDRAKQRAREIVEAYSVEDQFQVLTNDFEGRHQRLVSREDALALIDEIGVSPAVRELSKVLARQEQTLNSGKYTNQVAYIISDFQRNITDIGNYPDSTFEINLVPLQSVQERNISIDTAWFETPVQLLNQTDQLVVRVSNYSGENAENIRLSLQYEGQSKPVGELSVPANSTVSDTVPFTILRTGWHEARLQLTDYPVQFDDSYFLAFNVAEKIKVLNIYENTPNRYLESAFAGISYFEAKSSPSRSLDYSRFAENQLIVVDGLRSISSGLAAELLQYARRGGNVLVFPAKDADLLSYRSFLTAFPSNELMAFENTERQVGSINTQEFVFNDVFENAGANLKLPVTKGNFKFTNYNNRKEEQLLSYRDGSSFLSKYPVERGHLYICAAPMNEEINNLPLNGEIFIPMLYKMALSSGQKRPIAYTLGVDEVVSADHRTTSTEMVYKLKGLGEEFIPQQRIVGSTVFLTLNEEVKEAGFYQLFMQSDTILQKLAFNYNRKESELDYYNPTDLQAWVGDNAKVIDINDNTVLTAKIEERSKGVTLWRWCVILALLFLAAEVLLLRFWKL
ncbi:MAG: BatA domain-containing protein [Saprospiraceae bacterium]|nr:BatA domain-containing protein [Saprospiraceae bacterium]